MIRLESLCRNFQVGDQQVHALDSVSLTIGAGEHLSVMGPSGSGKSTLLHVLGLLDRADSGHYFFEDRDVTELDDNQAAQVRRERIGFVFQFFHLVPRLTAAQNIALPMTLAGIDAAERDARVSHLLDSVGLSDRAHHRPDQLSGGQRQRVAIARAMVMDPVLILADEPTGNLDRQAGHEVLRILEDLHERGKTLIVVTHDPEIGARAHRRIRMVDGRIVEDKS